MVKPFHPVMLCFVPAVVGFTLRLGSASVLDQRCLALAMLLLCADQARMAAVDLQDIRVVRSLSKPHFSGNTVDPAVAHDAANTTDPRLDRFIWVTLSTIVIELIGFYLALLWLGWGTAIVLMSQLWFHSLAGVQLQPKASEPILTVGVRSRSPVLIANTVGIVLILLWQYNLWPEAMAATLLAMVLIYGVVKYWPSPSVDANP